MEDLGGKKFFRLGFLGCGTVGTGAAKIILASDPPMEDKTGIEMWIHKIAVRDPHKKRDLDLPKHTFTKDPWEIVRDPAIDIVVEVMGGLEPARGLLLEALKTGKAVVTANKALLATHGKELFEAALAGNTSIGLEASVCGGIPLISSIRDGMVGNRIESIHGILNGTTNYILTRMAEEGLSFREGLKLAQEKGFAEADPSMDVEGVDAGQKLILISDLAFHSLFRFEEVLVEGIQQVELDDVRYAREMGYHIKLLAIAKRVAPCNGFPGGLELRVHPTLVPRGNPLAHVRHEFNAVVVKGDAVGDVMLYGRGAGMMPTGSAIVADILDAARGSARHTFTKLQFFQKPREDLPVAPRESIISRYYMRLNVQDQPGVLGRIALALGEQGISIASVIQKETDHLGLVPVLILTRQTREGPFRKACETIQALPFVREKIVMYRVED